MSSTGSSTDNDSGGADHDEDSTGVEPSAAFSAGLEALEQKDLNSSLRDALRSRVLALRSLDPCADGEAGEAEWALGSQAGVCAVTRMVRAGESVLRNVYFSWAGAGPEGQLPEGVTCLTCVLTSQLSPGVQDRAGFLRPPSTDSNNT